MTKEQNILEAVRKANPKKIRVTFFVTEDAKTALADWCHEKAITESAAVEAMIRATVPSRFFKEGK